MALPDEPITREEQYLSRAAGQDTKVPDPITREEKYLAKIAGQSVTTPPPITRKEQYLDYIAEHGGGGGGGDVTVEALSATANGKYTAPAGKAYSPVTVNVPNTYTAADEGKVVDSGVLAAQTSMTVTENDTYDTTLKNEVVVNVQPSLQSKSVTPTEQTQTVEPDSDKYGLSSVTVNPIPSSYIQPSGSVNIIANGTVDVTNYASAVVDVPTGGGSVAVPQNDVNFIDYDGTIVAAYSAADFANLTALPANPSHTGLTSQGWNYTLAQAKAYVSKYGELYIGQMYITDDGKTRIYISLGEGRLSPYLGICVNGSVDVDWGDNTEHSTVTGASLDSRVNTQHLYAAPGDYVIRLTVTGEMAFYYSSTRQKSALLWKNNNNSSEDEVYLTAIKKVEIGSGVTSIAAGAFSYCRGFQSITLPDSVTSIGVTAFQYCTSLRSVTLPDGVTSIGNNAFYYCRGLQSIALPGNATSIGTNLFSNGDILLSLTIPDGVTSIENGFLNSCPALSHITIPSTVTDIAASAFAKCYGLGEIHFKPATPPTVANSNAFSSVPSDCIIYVPSGSLSSYKTATNYPSPSNYTYVEEA